MAYGDFMETLQKERLLIKFYEIKDLILLKIPNMMDIKDDWLPWFINFLIKRLQAVVLNLCPKMSN